ncbi:MAG: carboxypeptidase regulatory-like domain-containing protein, partial [Vicinamibacteria bacterium]
MGRVQDATSGVLPGVTVTATHEATGMVRSVATNTDGFYQLRSLPTGEYTLGFELSGFRTVRQEGISVEASVNRTLNVAMDVGAVEETVTVTAKAEIIQTDTAAVAYQVSSRELEQVPSGTRNYTHLLATTAGVSSDLPPVAVNDTGSISPSVNGARTTSNSLMFNGIDVTSLLSNTGSLDDNIVPAPETIEEVKLQTSLYDASVGRAGGGSFQIVTKSGANSLSGSGYTFLQHENFASNEYFADRFGLEKPRARRYESGFNAGGPLKADKVFVYGSYQRTNAETGFVPTARSRALIPAALRLISGPRTAENIVSAFQSLNPTFNLGPGDISPVALAILNTQNPITGDFLIPGASGDIVSNDRVVSIGQYGNIGGDPLVEHRQIVPAEFQQDQVASKVDLQLTSANRLSGSFFYSKFPSENPFPDPTTLASPFPLLRDNEGTVF